MWRRDKSLFGYARNLVAQRRYHQLARGENASDESHLKALLLHFQSANYRHSCFAQLTSCFSQNVPSHLVARPGCCNHMFAETGYAVVCNRRSIDRGCQIIRYGQEKTKEFRTDVDAQTLANAIIFGNIGLVVQHNLFRETLSYAPIVQSLHQVVLKGVLREK